MYHRTESGSVEVFTLTADDFIKPYIMDVSASWRGRSESGDWRTEAIREALGHDPKPRFGQGLLGHPILRLSEVKEAAADLAGVYWWACFPGCLPDSDASGPFDTEKDALEDALGE